MLRWEEFVELRNLHERGWSVSAIARHLGKDRKTIRRCLADPDARPGVRKPAGRLLDPTPPLSRRAWRTTRTWPGRSLTGSSASSALPAPTGRWPGTWPGSVLTVRPATARSRPSRWSWCTAQARRRLTGRRFIGPRPGRLWRSRCSCSPSGCAVRSGCSRASSSAKAGRIWPPGMWPRSTPLAACRPRCATTAPPRCSGPARPSPRRRLRTSLATTAFGWCRVWWPVAVQGPDRAGVPVCGHLVLRDR